MSRPMRPAKHWRTGEVAARENHGTADPLKAEAYCSTCGGRYGEDIPPEHDCPNADGEPEWCGHCGAELMESGACDNDHSEEPDE